MCTSLVPLLNEDAIQGSLVALLSVLDASCITEVLNDVAPDKIAIVLRAPPEALKALVSAVDSGRFSDILIPVLREPDALLEETLVPLIAGVEQPGRVAAVVNQAELDVLLRLLRGVEAPRLVALLNALEPVDFEPQGPAIMLLHAMGDERGLTRDKVLPLLQSCDAAPLKQLVEQVSARQLLEVLRCVEVDGVLRLLENTNIELVVRLFNGPLEAAVSHVAGSLADAVRNPRVAKSVKHLTDALNGGFVAAEKKMQDVRDAVRRVQEEHGLEGDDPRHIGDLTRALLADVADKGKVRLSGVLAQTREESAALWRDLSEAVRLGQAPGDAPGRREDTDGQARCTVDAAELNLAESSDDTEVPEPDEPAVLGGREVPTCLYGDHGQASGLAASSDLVGGLAKSRGLVDAMDRVGDLARKNKLADAVDRSKEALTDAWVRSKKHLDSVLPGKHSPGREGPDCNSPEPPVMPSEDEPHVESAGHDIAAAGAEPGGEGAGAPARGAPAAEGAGAPAEAAPGGGAWDHEAEWFRATGREETPPFGISPATSHLGSPGMPGPGSEPAGTARGVSPGSASRRAGSSPGAQSRDDGPESQPTREPAGQQGYTATAVQPDPAAELKTGDQDTASAKPGREEGETSAPEVDPGIPCQPASDAPPVALAGEARAGGAAAALRCRSPGSGDASGSEDVIDRGKLALTEAMGRGKEVWQAGLSAAGILAQEIKEAVDRGAGAGASLAGSALQGADVLGCAQRSNVMRHRLREMEAELHFK